MAGFEPYADAALTGINLIHNITGGASHAERKSARSIMNYQQQLNKELFDYQNAYNTPAQQLERLKQAGLNVGLMYGSHGSIGNAASASLAPVNVPQSFGAYTNLSQVIDKAKQGLISAIGLKHQLDIQKEQRIQAREKTRQEQLRTHKMVNDRVRDDAEMPYVFRNAERNQQNADNAANYLANKYMSSYYDKDLKAMAVSYQQDTYKDRVDSLNLQNKIADMSLKELTYKVEEILPAEKALKESGLEINKANIAKIKAFTKKILQDIKQSAESFEWNKINIRPYEFILAKYNAYLKKEQWHKASVDPHYFENYNEPENEMDIFGNDMELFLSALPIILGCLKYIK